MRILNWIITLKTQIIIVSKGLVTLAVVRVTTCKMCVDVATPLDAKTIEWCWQLSVIVYEAWRRVCARAYILIHTSNKLRIL